jgi:hypothetical protein
MGGFFSQMNALQLLKNKHYFSFLFLLTILIIINLQEFISKSWIAFGIADEIIILLGIVYIFYKKIKNNTIEKNDLKIFSLILSSLAITIISFLVYSEQKFDIKIILLQTFISFKLFFLYIIFSFANKYAPPGFWTKILKYIITLSILGFILNIIYPSYFNFQDATFYSDRGARVVGFQLKPNDMAILLSCGCFYLSVLYRAPFTLSKYSIAHLLIFFAVVLTTSRSGLFIVVLGMIYGFYKNKSTGLNITFSIVFAFLFSIFFITSDSFLVNETIRNISEFRNIEESRYIRFIMLYNSFSVATSYFPFGSGAGTYGTVLSENSWIYRELGLQNLEFFRDFWGIYDSNVASIIGEYGFVFFVLVMFFTYKIIFAVIRNKKLTIYLFFIVLIVSTIQPFFAYQVNSANFLLLIFALSEIIKRKEFGIS